MCGKARAFVWLTCILVLSTLSQARVSQAAQRLPNAYEFHYLTGYQAFLDGYWGYCVDEMSKALEGAKEPLASQAKLKWSQCQIRLGNRYPAASQVIDLDPSYLIPSDQLVLSETKRWLGSEIDQLTGAHFWATSYFGGLTYTPVFLKQTANVVGLDLGLSISGWRIDAAGEYLSMNLVSPASTYQSLQLSGGIGREFSSNWDAHFRFTTLLSADSTQNGILILSPGFSYGSFFTRLHLDTFYSNYPASSLGTMNVFQQSLFLKQVLLWSKGFSMWAQLGGHGILAFAPISRDSLTGFNLKPVYYRLSGDLGFQLGIFSLGANAYFGDEAFGVRNEGLIAFTYPEDRLMGLGANLGVTFPTFSAQVSFLRETIAIGSLSFFGTTLLGSVTLGF